MTIQQLPRPEVIWHDVECGAYRADLGLWSRLAAEYGNPILDVGAGTGRVTLELARRGHAVTALDHDSVLVEELTRRTRTLRVSTVVADARQFSLEERFALIVVPMQTVQLLGGDRGRQAFLRCAAGQLARGGLLALALTEEFDLYRPGGDQPELPPDVRRVGATLYSSRPTAVRQEGGAVWLERRRETIGPGGRAWAGDDRVRLDRLSAERLEREARRAGLRPLGRTKVPATADHVGSIVVMLRA
jgi:SAM-dependent methyltransferase